MISDNIILIGPMGAGKTTIGKKLAKSLHRPFIDVDETIEQRLGVSISTIFDTEGEAGFRAREEKILTDILKHHHRSVIATGGGCVLTEGCRKMIVCQRLVVHIDVGIEQQCRRLAADKKRPILQGGHLRQKLIDLRQQRHAIYSAIADIHLLTDQYHFRQILRLIKEQLNE
ncbi:MAG: shikimate kinase I [Gammaproteobacteria bacterium]|nr:MAG: shikimate kinase I [Gammaproteobacteria bacterium]